MKAIPLVVSLLFALPALGQSAEATINSPVARTSEAKYKIQNFAFDRSSGQVIIYLDVQDSSNVSIRSFSLALNTSCINNCGCPATPSPIPTFDGLLGAMENAAASETGSNARRMQFRIMTYLVTTTACLQNVTLVP